MPSQGDPNHRGRFDKRLSYSSPGRMHWHGVCAWPLYAVSLGKTLLVGVESLASDNSATRPLDQLNAEVTTLVALKQHEHFECHTAFAALIRNHKLIELWRIDVAGAQSRIFKHYFAQIRADDAEVGVTPSAVVSFVILQREKMKSAG